MRCGNQEPACHLLRSDDTISKIVLQNSSLRLAQINALEIPLPENEYFTDAVFTVSDNGEKVVVVSSEVRRASVSTDAGKTWADYPMGADGYWYKIVVSGNGNSLAAVGEDVLSFSHDFGISWKAIDPVGWDEQIDFCWSKDANVIYLFDDEHLAKSTDCGESWSQYKVDHMNQPVCGIGNGYIWTKNGHFEIAPTGDYNGE
ncbi:hypothetical protein AB838_02160 [Rhodobacteraceae bacterium (ex Bugula neritina AB1)]|nr:hypothetical protein AB838_02160 [Rhodobacteraceae bacterium (ex Bugula neritina AB1)]